jgi:hypothetical protein
MSATACSVCACSFVGRVWCSRCYADLPPICGACLAAHRRVAPLLCPSCVSQLRRAPRGNPMLYRVRVTFADGKAGATLNVRSEAVAEAIRRSVTRQRPDAVVTVEAR